MIPKSPDPVLGAKRMNRIFSLMKEYLDTSPNLAKGEIQTNIDLMKRFAAEGK